MVPVVNENDTVATQELRYGDNDRLAARVAQMVSADCLVLLSDVDGLYTADPRRDTRRGYVDEVTEITARARDMAGGPGSSHGSGGMRTKLDAARIAIGAGCRMCIATRPRRAADQRAARGRQGHVVPAERDTRRRAQAVDRGHAETERRRARRRAARSARSLGGRSLLPAGVAGVDGQFERGDAVSVLGADGRELARGLVAYASDEARLIAGAQTAGIAEVLGYSGRDEIIHRDDLVLPEAARHGSHEHRRA